jgi:nitroreductase/NAD-dependent dihydropyrimidine dehydrogenase PreA subunit
MPDIRVDPEQCIACGACVALCTARVYKEADGGSAAVAPEECWGCGHCVAVCPADAIQHSGYPMTACPSLDQSAVPTLDKLVTSFRARRSSRVFREEPVPRQVVRELVDIARWVPSGSNAQPVDWLALDNPERIAELGAQAVEVLAHTARLLRNPLLRPILGVVVGRDQVKAGLESAEKFARLEVRHAQGRDPIFHRAPVVLIAHIPRLDYFGRDHAIYAAYNLMLAAQRLGLGTCQIGYFQVALDRSRSLRCALGLPEDRRAEVTLVLGYPAHDFQRLLPRRQPELTWNSAG